MTINTSTDITGGDAAVRLSTNPDIAARRIWLAAHGSSNARFGDVNVSATRGTELTADVTVTISANDADPMDSIALYNTWVYVPNGTSVTISWGQ